MIENKKIMIKAVEFYLKNMKQIKNEIQYRKISGTDKGYITINKPRKPIPYEEMESLFLCISKTVGTFNSTDKEFIKLRYENGLTLDVVCGLMCKKRSKIYTMGLQITDKILFDILMNDSARKNLMNSTPKRYII